MAGFAPVDDDALAAFERAYAERSDVTVTWLHEHGRFAVRCACDESDCEGFAMASTEILADWRALGHRIAEALWLPTDGASLAPRARSRPHNPRRA